MLRPLTLALAGLLLVVQADLWLGKGSRLHVSELRSQLQQQQRDNDVARERNGRVAAEVNDLKEGLEVVEEKARSELGMVRPDEIFVQVAPRR